MESDQPQYSSLFAADDINFYMRDPDSVQFHDLDVKSQSKDQGIPANSSGIPVLLDQRFQRVACDKNHHDIHRRSPTPI